MRKLVSLLLVAALVLGLFGTIGTAFAAPVFPDIAGNPAEKAIVKLNTLGIIDGYPDGTFKPVGNITRAEFAKIVVMSLAKGGSANLLKNTAAMFKDVPAGQWYTGYVNVAVANGIIKGYDDGTFLPQNNITEAEAATMVLRAMGYNDNLPGTWPLNYVMKAADLGIINDEFVAGSKATRAFVCSTTVSMLNNGKVTYTAATNSFSDPAATALLEGIAKAKTGTAVVKSYNAATGELTLADNSKLLVAATARVLTGDALATLAGKSINYMTTTVGTTTSVVYIEVSTAVVVGKVASVDAVKNQVTLTDGTVVTLSTSPVCKITKNGNTTTLLGIDGSDITALMDGGKAVSIVAYKLDITGTVAGKTTTVADGVTTLTLTLDGARSFTVPSAATIVRNGAVATFADLKVGDEIQMSANGTAAVYVDAFALAKTGVVTSKGLSADGANVLTVAFADGTSLVVDSTKTIKATDVTVGYSATFTVNRAGKATAVTANAPVVGSVTGKIVAIGQTEGTATVKFITLDNGVQYTVTAADGADKIHRNYVDANFSALTVGETAVLTLDNANKVTAIAVYANLTGLRTATGIANVIADNTYLATGAVVTLNGATSTCGAIAAAADRVALTWDVATGKLTSVVAVDFDNSAETVTGTTVTTNAQGVSVYTVTTVQTTGGITISGTAKIYRAGVAVAFDTIKIGDKISVGSTGAYVELTTDTTAVTITAAADAVNTQIAVGFNDPVKAVVVTVTKAGVPVVIDITDFAAGDTGFVVKGLEAATAYVVGIQATDFAGNVSSVSVNVTTAN